MNSEARRGGTGRTLTRLAVLVALLLAAVTPAYALDPSRQVTQYGHTAWRIKAGLFIGAPNTLTQSADGYIWVGTEAGLMRFDGVRFTPWSPPPGQPLPSPVVTALLGSRDGSVWIGTEAGLSRWANGRLTTYSARAGSIITIAEDRDGAIWFTRATWNDSEGPLCHVMAETLRCFGVSAGITDAVLATMVVDASGELWLGGARTLLHGKPGRFRVYSSPRLRQNADMSGVSAVVATPDDDVWVGIALTGDGGGLQRLRRGEWTPVTTPDLDGRSVAVAKMFADRDGGMWVGTLHDGIYRIHDRAVHRFRTADGLSGDNIFRFYEDREGSLWVVTSGGIDHFRELPVTTWSPREGLSSGEVDGVLATRDGRVLIASAFALDILDQNGLTSIQTGKGLPGSQVTSMFEDRHGRLWIGIDATLRIFENGGFKRIDLPDGRAVGLVVGITEDIDDNIWVEVTGAPRKLLRIRDGSVRDVFPTPAMPAARRVAGAADGGIWLGLMTGDLARWRDDALEVFSFRPDPPPGEAFVFNQLLVLPDGTVLGATSFGLIGWRNGARRTLTVTNGLPCNQLFGLVMDNEGDLWLYSTCGLIEVQRAALREWWTNPAVSVRALRLDTVDGARGSGTPFGAATRSIDGRLWFANGIVLQMVDPSRLRTNPLPPPVEIEEVVADRTVYAAQDALRLPPRTRELQISYTALSFVVPQRVRFKYKLEGHDADWVDPGTRRQAFYGDLPPGDYRFRVIASNNDGVWNEAGATLRFSVAPAWYETHWFYLASALTVVGIIWTGYRLRVRQIAARLAAQFDARMRERMRLARDLHDTLLQTITASKTMVDAELSDLAEPNQRRAAERVSSWLEQATIEGRWALSSLRTSVVSQPLALADALQRAAEEIMDGNAMAVVFRMVGDARDVHPIASEEVVAIGREAIWNACRHSNGTRLEIELRYDADLRLRVRDNGAGLPTAALEQAGPGHFGMQGMRERAANIGGTLRFVSTPGMGTEMILLVPGAVVYVRPSRAETPDLRRTGSEIGRVGEKPDAGPRR